VRSHDVNVSVRTAAAAARNAPRAFRIAVSDEGRAGRITKRRRWL